MDMGMRKCVGNVVLIFDVPTVNGNSKQGLESAFGISLQIVNHRYNTVIKNKKGNSLVVS